MPRLGISVYVKKINDENNKRTTYITFLSIYINISFKEKLRKSEQVVDYMCLILSEYSIDYFTN